LTAILKILAQKSNVPIVQEQLSKDLSLVKHRTI
jgi:hypothetical protein